MKRKPVAFDKEIFLRGDTYWYRGKPVFAKHRIEKSLGIKDGATRREILRAKAELLEAEENRGYVKGRTSFPYIRGKYLAERELEGLSAKTMWEVNHVMTEHFRFFDKHNVEDLCQPLFNEYCKTKKNITLHTHRKVMNHFLKWCTQNKYIKYRPEIDLPKFAKKPKREREILTDDEVRRLFQALSGPATVYHAMYLLMGMRNSEIVKLRWNEVNLETQAIQVNPMNNRVRKGRVIPINPWVLSLLKEMPKTSEWVFPSRRGAKKPHRDPSSGFRKAWLKALKDAGIDRHLTPHDMRATFEYWMHMNTNFTDTQREKMAGANIDVQKNIYVTMNAEALRGLENSVQVEGLAEIMQEKIGSISGAKVGAKHSKRGVHK